MTLLTPDFRKRGGTPLPRTFPVALVATCLTLSLLAGCGGGDGDKGTSPAQIALAATKVEEGRTELNTVLSGTQNPTAADLQSLRTDFTEAYNADNSNSQAAFGYAASEVAAAAQEVLAAAGAATRAAGAGSDTAQALAPITDTAKSVTPWSLQKPDDTTLRKTLSRATRTPFLLTRARIGKRAVDLGAVRTALVQMRGALDRAIPAAERAANSPTFAFTMYDFYDEEGTLTADQGDMQTFVAGLYAARAVVNVALSYDFNVGSFDFNQSIGDKFGAGLQVGTQIAPDSYLPPAPFGQLVDGGRASMNAAQRDLNTAADVALTASRTLQARTNGAGHLVPTTDVTEWDELRTGITTFKNALSQPYTTTGDQPVTINAAAFFGNPPASLRALLPTYVVTRVDGLGGGGFDDGNTIFFDTDVVAPDRTLGGLLISPPTGSLTASFNTSDTLANLATVSYLEME